MESNLSQELLHFLYQDLRIKINNLNKLKKKEQTNQGKVEHKTSLTRLDKLEKHFFELHSEMVRLGLLVKNNNTRKVMEKYK